MPTTPTPPTPSIPPDPVKAALWFVDQGFKVFPVWYPKTSLICSCPKGARCEQPGKHPVSPHGFKDATADKASIRTTLKNPGTQNYGLVCPEDVISVDVDGIEGLALWDELQHEHGPLPVTLTTKTANGKHVFYRVPGGHPSGKMFGFVVRDHTSGYVIGPGSKHASGVYYDTVRQPSGLPWPIAELPDPWVEAWMPASKPLIETTSGGFVLPESVPEGGRYDEVVRYTAHLHNTGIGPEEQWVLVRDVLGPRFAVAKTDTLLRFDFDKATKDMAARLGPPASLKREVPPIKAKTVDPGVMSTLIMRAEDYLASIPDHFDWIGNMAARGYVTLVAAPPKAGKSTLISGLLRCRGTGEPFLGHAVPVGPTLLLAEEAGPVIKRKIEGISGLEIMTRVSFKRAGFGFAEMLGVIRAWAVPGGLVVIDTLAKWAEVKDENDAAVMGAALDAIIQIAQELDIAIIVIHHTKKGGGEHGEALRGSSAILGSVDHVIEVEFGKNGSDHRVLIMYGRLDFPNRMTVDFDRSTLGYEVIETAEAVDVDHLDLFPEDGKDEDGWRESDLAEHWGIKGTSAANRARKLAVDLRLVSRMVKAPGARAAHTEWWKPGPKIILGGGESVGSRMAAIFHPDERSDAP